ncbi:hypothetical protein LBBP_01616 [Leptospira borgpetersenii serovar Ballum]|uniref:Uncharacterized protein n=1 Tax=Leptospira borgpetersenii serovar Ballum TaxID=280505 RepID=A0A0S2IQH4_LEPBO|nr:hypothetical protein LBBP_01616 [Leptospira borgpetersenii serovar Ballum]
MIKIYFDGSIKSFFSNKVGRIFYEVNLIPEEFFLLRVYPKTVQCGNF